MNYNKTVVLGHLKQRVDALVDSIEGIGTNVNDSLEKELYSNDEVYTAYYNTVQQLKSLQETLRNNIHKQFKAQQNGNI